mgnify:CR=1
MHSQSIITNQGWFQAFFQAKHFSAILALSFSLILSACGGGGSSVTENDLVDPGSVDLTIRYSFFVHSRVSHFIKRVSMIYSVGKCSSYC